MALNKDIQVLRHYHSPQEFSRDFYQFITAMQKLRKLGKEDRLDSIFAEKVMLAVVGVNKCECCSYNHTIIALERGILKEDIERLLSCDTDNLTDMQIPAILYAQHWADTKGKVQQTALDEVITYYGKKKATHLEALISLAEFTSLCNNTVSVYKSTQDKKGIGFFFSYLQCLPFHAIMKRQLRQNQKLHKIKM
jgi:AhpD family alkylhydroperoxidase